MAIRALRCAAVATLLLLGGAARALDAVDPRELAPQLRAGDFAAVEARLAELDATGARTREGWLAPSRSLFALGIAAAEDPDVAESLAAWLRTEPNAWTAQMIEGWRLVMYRHALRPDDRSLEGVEIWNQDDPELRSRARAAFERAQTLAPKSSEPGAALLALLICQRAPLEERFAALAAACAVDRRCETARTMMLTGLEPYLGGSNDLLLAFARKTVAELPDDPVLGFAIGIAHRKAALNSKDPAAYFARADVYEEAERSYAQHLARYPDALRHWNEYARIACWAGRRDTAHRIFDRIGAGYMAPAWKDDFAEFVKRRAWAVADQGETRARMAP
jgi:tetratricopeptide (TPR) repeat protein